MVFAAFSFLFQAFAADYVIVVDTSGSMTEAISKSDRRIRIATVQEALANYLNTLPRDSRVYLLSFNTGIRSEKEFIFRTDTEIQGALSWVAGLGGEARTGGNTHLWTTLQRALEIATAYAKQNADQTVVVRALTDGMDNEGKTSLEAVLGRFPLLDGKSIRANLVLLGDLEVKLKQAREGFEIETKTVWTDLFPPVIQWKPAPVLVGQETSFYDNSQSVYQKYEWLIDGKPIGNQKVLTQRFDHAGRYRLKLVVVGTSGLRTYSEMDVQVVESDLTVDFVVSQSEIEPNQEIKFFSRVTGKPSSFVWSVDGKESATQQDCAAKFEAEGEHEVKLIVRDAFGKTASRVRAVRVKEPAVEVSFKGPKEVMTGQAAQFVNECTGNIAKFEWDFGDGQKGIERHPSHVYKNEARSAKDRQIVLRVTTATGKTFQSAPFTVSVLPATTPPPPQATFKVIGSTPYKAGLLVQFVDESKGTINSYAWDFAGDGSSAERNPEHTFSTPGSKLIRLTVSGPGGTDSAQKELQVIPRYQPPSGRIKVSATHGTAPVNVTLAANLSGDYETVQWTFGDGVTAQETNVTHRFSAVGVYHVKLLATPKDSAQKPYAEQLDITMRAPMSFAKKLLLASISALLVALVLGWWIYQKFIRPPRFTFFYWVQERSTHNVVAFTQRDEELTLMEAPLLLKREGKAKTVIIRPAGEAKLKAADGQDVPQHTASGGGIIVVEEKSGELKTVTFDFDQEPPAPAPAQTASPTDSPQATTPANPGDPFGFGSTT